ncbi:unnamed protein product [Bathycoccus prasinos]
MMNFIKIPQLLIPILFVVLSLSNAFAFAAEEEEIVAFQSELPSDASTYTIKQQGEHWNSPGWRIEGYTKDTFTTEIQELFKTGLSQYAAVHGYKYGSANLDFPDLLVKPSLRAANVEIVSVENHANTANAVIVN